VKFKLLRFTIYDWIQMRFEHPQILWLLLVLPAALAALFWFANAAESKNCSRNLSPARLLPALTSGHFARAARKLRFAFLILAVAFLIIALARPQHGLIWKKSSSAGLDIVVAVDTSKSMLTTDIAPDRLERAKLAALELMQRAKARSHGSRRVRGRRVFGMSADD
jgi:Ca-activated chloride channel family protein